MRAPNEIDFWRGLALVSIFINHIPGFAFERFTHRNYGYSDSAELFVFLAGWGLRRLSDASSETMGLPRLILRLGARGITLYAAQIVLTMLAIALIAAAALFLDNPLLLGWHNAAAVFENPVPAHLGLILLTHQLGFFDILPLYVVLMLGAPLLAIVHRFVPAAVLPLSLALWAATLGFEINLPTWPVEGVWYFNPFAWQLVFVLGFLMGADAGPGRLARRLRPWLRPAAGAAVLAFLILAVRDVAPDPMQAPEPKLFFIVDKTYLIPLRVIHFLTLVLAFAGTFRLVLRWARWPARYLAMLGRNSLHVFCVGSLLSLSGQIARFWSGGSFLVDLGMLLGGFCVLGFTAWISELRERLRRPVSQPVSAGS